MYGKKGSQPAPGAHTMKSKISGKTRDDRAKMRILLACSAGVALLLSGCGAPMKVTSTPVVPAAKGTVMGGQQPLPGVNLQFYTTATASPGSYGSAAVPYGPAFATNPGTGSFSFPTLQPCPAGSEVFLVGSDGDPVTFAANNTYIKLMVGLGSCSTFTANNALPSYHIVLNELTTVATIWSLGGFMTGPTNIGAPTSNATGLQNAFATINELVNVSTGKAVSTLVPSGTTLPLDRFYALGDILQNCINSNGGSPSDPVNGTNVGSACDNLMFLTTLPSTTAPTDIATAAMNIAQHPGGNVANVSNANYLSDLYNLQGEPIGRAFPNNLTSPPTDWTLAINYTAGGLASPQSVAVDGFGNVWVTNKPSTGTGSVTELTVTSAATSTPVYAGANYTTDVNSPYGVAIDTSNNAWITNTGNNSITMFGPGGASPANYNSESIGLSTPEGIAIDGAGNIWAVNNFTSTLSGMTGLPSPGTPLANSPYGGVGQPGGLNGPSSIAVNPIAASSPVPSVVRK